MISEGISPDNVTYYTLIQGCLTLNQQDFALNILNEAIQKSKFTESQSQILYQLLKNIMIDEYNMVAINRFYELDQVLMHFQSQLSTFDNKENHEGHHQLYHNQTQPLNQSILTDVEGFDYEQAFGYLKYKNS